MNLKEYQKVRDLNPREIKQAIDDFKNATPILRSGEKEEWSARVGDKIKNAKNALLIIWLYFILMNKCQMKIIYMIVLRLSKIASNLF